MPADVYSQHEESATRSQLLCRALVCGGAAIGGLAAWGLPQLSVASPSEEQDKRVLKLVLALEYVEAAFYKEALARAGLKGELRQYARIVAGHERAHADFVAQALGSAAQPEPAHDFGDSTKDPDAFTAAAVALEDLAVATYNGQAGNLTIPTLKAAARIVSVEARHAAWIRSIAGEVPATRPTDPAANEAATRARLRDIDAAAG
jgi:rubrerythrin